MKSYVITGGGAGIGAAVKQQLLDRGDEVLVIDIKDADVIADLSNAAGRQAAIDAVTQKFPEGFDGLVPCAGLGPHVTPSTLITQVNFFGATTLIEGLAPLLVKRRGTIVAISSNSASLPGYRGDYIQALLAGDEAQACNIVASLDGQTAYGGSKNALAIWVRRHAPSLMGDGVRLNAVAPGITRTAMTEGVKDDDTWGEAIKEFSKMTPSGCDASPEMIANTILFLLDPASEFVCGAILFVDGGTDALLRPESF